MWRGIVWVGHLCIWAVMCLEIIVLAHRCGWKLTIHMDFFWFFLPSDLGFFWAYPIWWETINLFFASSPENLVSDNITALFGFHHPLQHLIPPKKCFWVKFLGYDHFSFFPFIFFYFSISVPSPTPKVWFPLPSDPLANWLFFQNSTQSNSNTVIFFPATFQLTKAVFPKLASSFAVVFFPKSEKAIKVFSQTKFWFYKHEPLCKTCLCCVLCKKTTTPNGINLNFCFRCSIDIKVFFLTHGRVSLRRQTDQDTLGNNDSKQWWLDPKVSRAFFLLKH